MKKSILAILAIAAAGSVMAEAQPYATITNAQGLSTVAVGNKLVNAVNGMKLAEGAQVLTTAKSAVTVDFAGLCTATLKSGQALSISLADCKSFVAQHGSPMLNGGSGAAAGGITEGLAASFGVSSATAVAVAGALGIAATVGVADATRSDRYVEVKNADGTFTVTDKDTGKQAILSADRKTVSPVVTAAVVTPTPVPAAAAPAPAISGS